MVCANFSLSLLCLTRKHFKVKLCKQVQPQENLISRTSIEIPANMKENPSYCTNGNDQ